MYTTSLRKVGGSVMLAVPPAIPELLKMQAGTAVGVSISGDCLVVTAQPRPQYALEDLLAQSDYDAPLSAEDREWLDAPSLGREP